MAISKPSPYVPSFLRAALSGSRPLTLTWADVADTNIASTSSFQYDPHQTPLKSSQQLNVDWSQFQNHTFFMSAEAKVNLAFDAIINGFPFDGTRLETEVFFDNLTGFDKWVFDNFPVFRGELLFQSASITGWIPISGSTAPTDNAGTYIVVQNKTGALFPELSKQTSGQTVLNPTGSMTLEMQLYLPPVPNDVQTVCQMMSSSVMGFSFYLTQSLSTTTVTGYFSIVSGSSYMTVPVQLNKGIFNHVAFVLNRDNGLPFLEAFLLSEPVAEAATQVEMGDLTIDHSNFIVGAGTPVQLGFDLPVVPMQTFNGIIDEFRFFHSARTPAQMAAYAAKALFATTDLQLYFRFNEPPPPIAPGLDNIVLDSSGNSLHSQISNFTGSLRLDSENDPLNPVIYERPETVPVLFPAYPPTVAFNQSLLASASVYDQENPNLITKLVPQHYLLEGALQDGFIDPPEGNEGQPFGGGGIPGSGQMGNVQVLVSLLYIWARFFDEVKLFIDAFSTLKTVNYDTNETVPDSFLLDLVKSFGFHLPPLFNDSTLEQYVRGENVDLQAITTSEQTLRQVQSQLLRRVLINLPDVLKSKGTQHSIKSFLRAVGIDPGNNVRIREFGGPTTQQLAFTRETKLEPGTMVQFYSGLSGSIVSGSTVFTLTGSLALSPYLTASRTEPGFPPIQGNWVQQDRHPPQGISDNRSDGVLTSGSWTWEGIVKFTPASIAMMNSSTQSLCRICTVGSSDIFGDDTFGSESPFGYEVSLDEGHMGLVANLLAVSSSMNTPGNGPKLVLYIRPNDYSGPDSKASPMLRLEIDTQLPNIYTGPPAIGIFNFDRWNISFGCQRGDDGLNSPVSSSYFLRLAYQNDGEIQYLFQTSSFFEESPIGGTNVLRAWATGSSFLGPFLAVGAGQDIESGTGSILLNNILVAPDEARATDFVGRMSNVRFWSRALTLDEWREHVRNYNSIGVEDPLVNWNYVHTRTGSFGKLRMNTMIRQDVRQAVSTGSLEAAVGSIVFPDFSENNMAMTGSGWPIPPVATDVVVGEIFDLSYLSPYFDEATNDQKVRARSFQNFDIVEHTPWASLGPVYELVASELPTDDVRFIIEFSLIDALNRDIVTMFATLDAIDNALGAPELVFSPDYPDLARLRDVYFNRIKEKLNFQAFFEFFRWFDTSIGTFIQQLIPRKTRFKGTNFTIESHMLERAKQEYLSSEIYLGDSIRQNLDAVILLQQIVGSIRKY